MGRIEVPSSWKTLTPSALRGVILIVGATDTGKTTLARYLYRRLSEHHERVAFVDGDVGQATLGPPTTMSMVVGRQAHGSFPPAGPRFCVFVGDISPSGHMLPTVVGAYRLVRKAREAGATAIVCDTTGLVGASQGGSALKLALVDLLQPEVVIALQRESELEHLLVPLRASGRTRVVDRGVAEAVERRDVSRRQKHRVQQYRRAFETAELRTFHWLRRSVIPSPSFTRHRLVALEDDEGFVLQLGIVTDVEWSSDTVELYTALPSFEGVDTIHVGDVAVDPQTFRDERL